MDADMATDYFDDSASTSVAVPVEPLFGGPRLGSTPSSRARQQMVSLAGDGMFGLDPFQLHSLGKARLDLANEAVRHPGQRVRDVNVEVWQFLFLWPYSLRSDTLGQEVPFAETPCQPGTGAISDSH